MSLRAQVRPLYVSSPSTNQPSSGAEVSTGWNPSPDTNVTGYFLCWGLASGQCTNFIDVGDVTNATLGGLTTNTWYYFNVVAHDDGGDQAVPSNEIQYMATNQVSAVDPPAITSDLSDQTVAAGASISLQVGVSGTAPLAYQWFWNGTPLPGATDDPLVLNNVNGQLAGIYQLVVTNAAGSVTSTSATISVVVPPTIITDLSNQSVAAGSNLCLQVVAAGTAPLTYQWFFNGAILPGVTANSLTLSDVSQKQAGTYQVTISDAAGSVPSAVATVTVLQAPNLLNDLTNLTAASGVDVSFSISAEGSAPLSYQWYLNGSALAGATADVLSLPQVSTAQSGVYQVAVSNPLGKIASSRATLNVLQNGTLLISPNPTGLLNLTYAGGPNQNYSVQYSSQLNAGWQSLASTNSDAYGILSVSTSPTNSSALFRVATP